MNLRDHFVAGSAILGSLGVDYWASCGTLLGLVRNGALLPHESDVDFATFEWERHDEIATAFQRAGYGMKTLGDPEDGYEQSFFRRDAHLIDIFYFYPSKRNRCWQASYTPEEMIVSEFDQALFLPTRSYDFHGIETRLPAKPVGVLEARYGEWRDLTYPWNYAIDPLCISKRVPR